MKQSKWITLLCAVLLIAAQGCSSDDEDPGDFDPTIAAAEEVTGAIVTDVVQPLFALLNVARGFIPMPAAPPPGLLCTPIECTSGTGDICPTSATAAVVSMNQCVIGTSEISGTIDIVQTGPSSASATLSVNVDGTTLSGQMNLSASGTCVDGALSNFSAGTSSTATFMSGLLTDCGTGVPEDGSFLSAFASTDAGDFNFDMFFDGSSTASATFFDASSGSTLAICTANLISGDANCDSV